MKFVATWKGMTSNIFYPSPLLLLFLDPGAEIRDPGWAKIRIRDKHPGSASLSATLPVLFFVVSGKWSLTSWWRRSLSSVVLRRLRLLFQAFFTCVLLQTSTIQSAPVSCARSSSVGWQSWMKTGPLLRGRGKTRWTRSTRRHAPSRKLLNTSRQ